MIINVKSITIRKYLLKLSASNNAQLQLSQLSLDCSKKCKQYIIKKNLGIFWTYSVKGGFTKILNLYLWIPAFIIGTLEGKCLPASLPPRVVLGRGTMRERTRGDPQGAAAHLGLERSIHKVPALLQTQLPSPSVYMAVTLLHASTEWKYFNQIRSSSPWWVKVSAIHM